jgi:hypothetical protein
MNIEDWAPALVVILLLVGFIVSFLWRLYIGSSAPDEPPGTDEQSGMPPDRARSLSDS